MRGLRDAQAHSLTCRGLGRISPARSPLALLVPALRRAPPAFLPSSLALPPSAKCARDTPRAGVSSLELAHFAGVGGAFTGGRGEGLCTGMRGRRARAARPLRQCGMTSMSLDELSRIARRLRPGERVSHTTAARVYGLPLPRRAGTDIHVTIPIDQPHRRRAGWLGHRDAGDGAGEMYGVPISTPEQTFLELARLLRLDELIAVGDDLVHVPRKEMPGRPWTTREQLADFAREGRRRKGSPLARAALLEVRDGVESPMETALRLLLVRAGLPEPVCGHHIPGIGWFDLAWPECRVLGEYDGDQHRTSTEQYEKDIGRFDLAMDDGWRPVRVRAAGLTRSGRGTTIDRFRRALAA